MNKPEFVLDKHLQFMDRIDPLVSENIFVVVPKLLTQFPEINPRQAQDIVHYWGEQQVRNAEVHYLVESAQNGK